MPILDGQLSILEALGQPACVVEAESMRIVTLNSRACREFHVAPSEWRGKKLRTVMESDAADWDRLPGSIDKPPGPISLRVQIPTPVDRMESRMTVSRFEEEGGAYALCLFDPVDPASDEETGDLSHRLRKLFDHSNDLIFTYDDGRFTSINPAGQKIFGYDADAMVGQPLTLVADRDSLREAMQKYEALYESGKPTPTFEVRCINSNRDSIWIELSVLKLLEGAHDLGSLGIGREITERKRAEQAMLDSQRRLREQKTILSRVIDQNPYAIALWNPDGELRQCNNAFVRLIGRVPGAGYNLLKDPQAREMGVQSAFERAFLGETVFLDQAHYNVNEVEGGGAVRPLRFSIILFPVVDAQDQPLHLVTIFQDLARENKERAARNLLEAQLRHAQKMEAIGTLAGGIAHDFNNLLTGVIGYLDMIRAEVSPEVHAHINGAEKAAQRACELTRQLLAYARRNRMEIIVHDLNTTVREVAALIEKTIDTGISLELDVCSDAVPILADPGQMNQVLMNLCLNARDAVAERLETKASESPADGRIRVRCRKVHVDGKRRVSGAASRRGWFACLSVMDTGVGMDPETRSRIFDPFFTTKPVGRGTGLGLATLFGIVSQHDGWIDVLSKPGLGSCFRLYIPLVDAEPQQPSDAAASVRVPGGNETILLVDDEETIRELGKDILEGRGYTVHLAKDGQDALERFEADQEHIDLIVLDLAMPRLSGKDALPRLKEVRGDIPVIVSSGFSSEEETQALLDQGAAAFVEKPYHAFDLLREVRNALDASAVVEDG